MADTPIESARPVGGMGKPFARHPDLSQAPATATDADGRAVRDDSVEVRHGRTLALDLLRQRVLAHSRRQLELDPAAPVPEFAEVADGEPIPTFLGRLLSAQNQLAARCVGRLAPHDVRRRLDLALQEGAEETMDMLVEHGSTHTLAVVVDVLQEYGRRLAALG